MANLETVSARVFEENGVIEYRLKSRTFNIPGARANCNVGQQIYLIHAFGPEGNSILIGRMGRGFCDAEELGDLTVGGLELQPAGDPRLTSEPKRREQGFVEGAASCETVYAEIDVIETPRHCRNGSESGCGFRFGEGSAEGCGVANKSRPPRTPSMPQRIQLIFTHRASS